MGETLRLERRGAERSQTENRSHGGAVKFDVLYHYMACGDCTHLPLSLFLRFAL